VVERRDAALVPQLVHDTAGVRGEGWKGTLGRAEECNVNIGERASGNKKANAADSDRREKAGKRATKIRAATTAGKGIRVQLPPDRLPPLTPGDRLNVHPPWIDRRARVIGPGD
jgi:hypothetical protein